jgi:hypothetical protein
LVRYERLDESSEGDMAKIDAPRHLPMGDRESPGNQLTAATSGPVTGQPGVALTSAYRQFHDLTSLVDSLSSVGRTIFTYDRRLPAHHDRGEVRRLQWPAGGAWR